MLVVDNQLFYKQKNLKKIDGFYYSAIIGTKNDKKPKDKIRYSIVKSNKSAKMLVNLIARKNS